MRKFDERDKKIIENPLDWPRFPFLPVKRSSEAHLIECAVIWSRNPTTIVKAHLFGLPQTSEEFLALPNYKYETVDAILADGWVVD